MLTDIASKIELQDSTDVRKENMVMRRQCQLKNLHHMTNITQLLDRQLAKKASSYTCNKPTSESIEYQTDPDFIPFTPSEPYFIAQLNMKASSLPDDIEKQVIVTEALPPRLYGLPKIHKQDVPLRPIVSAIGAPTYLLAKHLTTLLQLYIGGKPSYIRDSAHFVEKFRKMRFNPGDIVVSFDVVSLFTQVLLVRYIGDLFPIKSRGSQPLHGAV
ncbi:hypothetical protein Trydic_g3288 [Trypoxylus dichotomus]